MAKHYPKHYPPVSRATYVCLDCRRTQRADSSPCCQDCGQAMRSIGKHFRAPKRADIKGWADLRRRLAMRRRGEYGHKL